MQEEKESIVREEAGDEGIAGGEADEFTPTAVGDATANADFARLGELSAAYEKAVAERQEFFERLLRKQAELENFRKRAQREKDDFLQLANADLLRSLLPTLDGFERALKQRDPNVPPSFYEGLEHIHRQLLDTLRRAGLESVDTAGRIFDPHLHQAVETVESDEHRDHEIVEELQRGYKLKNRLLRPAIVKVAVPVK
ncbi:MAG: nucleotide exchange factor GrpE [Terriglobia bacterium]